LAQSTLTQFQILPRPRWRGFSFALHRHGAGLFFLPGGVSASHNRLRMSFCRQCNYTTTTPKPFTGLYRGFSVDFPYFSAYNTAAAQAAYTTAAPDAVKLSTAAYYNKVYKGAGLRPLL
jgi:hypothetical protein